MKLKQFVLLASVFCVLISPSSWAGEGADESAMGAVFLGYGALYSVSSPLVVASGAVTGDGLMAAKGAFMGAAAPEAAISGTGRLLVAASQDGVEASKAIVHLVNASGEKLTELNEQVFDSLSLGQAIGNVPTAQAQIHNQPKAVPLIVRKQYVQMNEKVTQ